MRHREFKRPTTWGPSKDTTSLPVHAGLPWNVPGSRIVFSDVGGKAKTRLCWPDPVASLIGKFPSGWGTYLSNYDVGNIEFLAR